MDEFQENGILDFHNSPCTVQSEKHGKSTWNLQLDDDQ